MKISFQAQGSFQKLETFVTKMSKGDLFRELDGFAKQGVAALAAATPVSSGLAANSWHSEVNIGLRTATVTWTNSDVESGFPVAIMLQYGYSTGTGGWVQGRDYINPAIRPIFDKIANQTWKAVTSA